MLLSVRVLLNRSASSNWKWGLKLNSIEIELNWIERELCEMHTDI